MLNTLIKLMQHWRGHGCQGRSRKGISLQSLQTALLQENEPVFSFLRVCHDEVGLVLEISDLHAMFELLMILILTMLI